MDALKFFKEFDRMCNYYSNENCRGCPRETEPTCGITDLGSVGPEGIKKLINDVDQWSKEHPQRTRLEDFKEKYPHAMMETDGTPTICCIDLGYRQYDCDPLKENCVDCWNMPVEDE